MKIGKTEIFLEKIRDYPDTKLYQKSRTSESVSAIAFDTTGKQDNATECIFLQYYQSVILALVTPSR